MRLVMLSAMLVLSCTVAQSAGPLNITVGETVLEVQEGGSPVLQYKYRDVPFKPYALSWFTPKGVNILRDAPEDHKHHHGLMYAIKLGDINFWEETEVAGRQVHRALTNVRVESDRAGFTETIAWLGPESKKTLVSEQRTLTHHATGDAPVRLLTWESVLKGPKAKGEVTLAGSIYYGLGMLFPVFMDKVGTFRFAADETGAFDDGPHHLAQAAWCAYTVADAEHPVTVAMFSAKENPRPTLWFTMLEPFSYLAGTFDLSRNPITLKADETLTAQYGLAAWDGEVSEQEIENVYKQWTEMTHEKRRNGLSKQ